MADSPRLSSILAGASELADPSNFEGTTTDEADISCSFVPFGFVRIWRRELASTESPDEFWSSCIAADQHLSLLPASIEKFEPSLLSGVVEVIQSDLARVKGALDFSWLQAIQESFVVNAACRGCCGRVLFVRNRRESVYVHWHRES